MTQCFYGWRPDVLELLGGSMEHAADDRNKKFWSDLRRQNWDLVALDARPNQKKVLVVPLRYEWYLKQETDPIWVSIYEIHGNKPWRDFVIQVPGYNQPDTRAKARRMTLKEMRVNDSK